MIHSDALSRDFPLAWFFKKLNYVFSWSEKTEIARKYYKKNIYITVCFLKKTVLESELNIGLPFRSFKYLSSIKIL